MFGYVKPNIPSLRVVDFEYYKAAYCSLCRYMGQECGASCRFALSYDITFMSLLRIALGEEEPSVERHLCPFAPVKKNMLSRTESVSLAAAAGGVLAALKNEDDINDERGRRRLRARLLRPTSRAWIRRARRKRASLVEKTESGLSEFYRIEELNRASSTPDGNLDAAADAFGALLGELTAQGMPDENYAIAYQIGKHVGRWVYFVDALDDMEDDIAKGRYNPIVAAYGGRVPSDDEKLTLLCLLDAECDGAMRFLALTETDTEACAYKIVENTICESMPRVARSVLDGSYKKSRREDIIRSGTATNIKKEEGK